MVPRVLLFWYSRCLWFYQTFFGVCCFFFVIFQIKAILLYLLIKNNDFVKKNESYGMAVPRVLFLIFLFFYNFFDQIFSTFIFGWLSILYFFKGRGAKTPKIPPSWIFLCSRLSRPILIKKYSRDRHNKKLYLFVCFLDG